MSTEESFTRMWAQAQYCLTSASFTRFWMDLCMPWLVGRVASHTNRQKTLFARAVSRKSELSGFCAIQNPKDMFLPFGKQSSFWRACDFLSSVSQQRERELEVHLLHHGGGMSGATCNLTSPYLRGEPPPLFLGGMGCQGNH